MTYWRRLVAFVGVVASVTAAASGQCSGALASVRTYADDAAVQQRSTPTDEHRVPRTAIRASFRAESASSGSCALDQ
jgi:hypothetical protein